MHQSQKLLQASLFVIALLLLVGIVFGWFSGSARSQSPAIVTSQRPLPFTASPSRYQLLFSGDFEFMVDTQTGRLWYRSGPGTSWIEESPDTTKSPAYTK